MNQPINEHQPLLRLTRFNGVELFTISSARFNIYEESGSVFGVFRLEAGDAVQVLEDTEILNGCPCWELVWRVPSATIPTLTPGMIIEIPGYDSERQENITNFSYTGGGSESEDNRITVLQVSDGTLRARVLGETVDVNYYDGSKPPTLLEVVADFQRDPTLGRSFI